MRESWIPYRRRDSGRDSELLGWIDPRGEEFVAIDLLGRELDPPTDWVSAEERLEGRGIGYLADAYTLDVDGTLVPVRIAEVSAERIVCIRETYGSIDVPREEFSLPFPPVGLRPR